MQPIELRASEDSRRWLLQGLWLQRVLSPRAGSIVRTLEWILEAAGSGEPLPPAGFIADVGHLALGLDTAAQPTPLRATIPGFPPGLLRGYEDYVLGKLYADWTFERGSEAVRRYRTADRPRALVFLLEHCRTRAELPGIMLNPAVVRRLLEQPPEETLAEAWESLSREGVISHLRDAYDALVAAIRDAGELLGPEDVFELEHGTAVAAFSQRLALRQVLQATAALQVDLPQQPPRRLSRQHLVPTRTLEEDTYPVGGFSSISTRGTVESLLYSQLAYMEKGERPDLFDIKFLRDELLYYARDENEFLRRRRTFVFALFPELVRARIKDAELPWQRLVMLLAFVLAAMQKLTDWLSSDGLHFDLVFVEEGGACLEAEQELMTILFREGLANGTATITGLPRPRLSAWCAERGRRSLCELLTLAESARAVEAELTRTTTLALSGPAPNLRAGTETIVEQIENKGLPAWSAALEWLLHHWL